MARLLTLFALLCALAYPAPALGQVQETADEVLLRTEAGFATDDKSLLQWIRRKSESADKLPTIDGLIEQLGSELFEERESAYAGLVRIGAAALPMLRPHTDHPDLEVARRVRACIRTMEHDAGPGWSLTIVRLLIARKPIGALDALLTFLPCADGPELEEVIYYGIDQLLGHDGLPPKLLAALSDPLPARRALACCIVARRGTQEQRDKVQGLLAGERNAYVRLRAAQGLLAGRDRRAIAWLIEMLREPCVSVAWQAEELLHWAALNPPAAVYGTGTPDERRACHEAWARWWRDHEPSFSWPDPELRPGTPGLVMLTTGLSTVEIVGSDHSTRYRLQYAGQPVRIGWLPGARLVAFRPPVHTPSGAPVEVWDLRGKSVAKINVPFLPACWRAANAGTLELVGEPIPGKPQRRATVDLEGNLVCPSCGPGTFLPLGLIAQGFGDGAVRLGNGNTLRHRSGDEPFASAGVRVVEETPEGAVIWESFASGAEVARPVEPLVRFGFVPAGSVESLPYRLACLKSPNVHKRAFAAARLRLLPLDAAAFAAIFDTAMNDPETQVRAPALRALAQRPAECRVRLAEFLRLLDRENRTIQGGLMEIMRAVGPEAAIPALVQVFEKERSSADPTRRMNAVLQLGFCFLGMDARVDATMRAALRDPASEVREASAVAIGWHAGAHKETDRERPSAALPFIADLIAVVNDPDPDVAKAALHALATPRMPSAAARPVVLKMLRERKELRYYVVIALCGVPGDRAEVVAAILPYLDAKDDPLVVGAVIETLGSCGNAAQGAVKPLVEMLKRGMTVRPELPPSYDPKIVRALGKIGPGAREAVPVLKGFFDQTHGGGEDLVLALEAIDPAQGRIVREVFNRRVSHPLPPPMIPVAPKIDRNQ